jgi:coenzyme F420-reducing hydrogenase gamma subunit
MVAVKGCPPSRKRIVEAFHQVGIPIDPAVLEEMDKTPAYFMKKYEGKPGFDESFFRVE